MRSTNDPSLRSFLDVDPASPFPIQNLPLGVFRPGPDRTPRVGVAIGDWVLDLFVLEERGLLRHAGLGPDRVFDRPDLRPFMGLGPPAWRAVRERVSHLLRRDVGELRDDRALRDLALADIAAVQMCMPCRIGGFTDFYASREHAANVGSMLRGPDAVLPPNYLHMPIGYNGRASSVVLSGTPIPRPRGQFRVQGQDHPQFGPTRALDFELEVGLFVGPGNAWGRPIPLTDALDHAFGLVLVNDWSARDIQAWEYVPLGPFLGKSFATTISPWIVPWAALEPFRCAGPPQDPPPPAYLRTAEPAAVHIRLEAAIATAGLPSPYVVTRTDFAGMYWTLPQMIAHHTVNGCNLRPGDLLASGTVSGPTPESRGCLLERTWRGEQPIALPDGRTRTYLEDGDTVILTGWCDGPDYRIGFGECRGTVLPALEG